MIGSAGSVWLNTQSQYRGIDDTPTEMAYKINNGLDDTLHDRKKKELFNGRYRIGGGRRKCVVEIQETMVGKKIYDHRTQFWCPHPHC